MGSQSGSASYAALRVATQRLSSTPHWQLPYIAPILAGTIAENSSLLSVPSIKASSEHNVLVHKLKTQISTLLQDKRPQARWLAVVLAKAVIEAGGHEILQSTGPWVRSMITILGKPDSPSTKKLCLTTLTRIFLLTHGHQSLVREITTPVLPAFITVSLKILSAKPDQSLSLVITQTLAELLPHHPSSFRPFVAPVRACISPFIAATPASIGREPSEHQASTSEDISNTSRRLYVLLSACAPKKTENEEWGKSVRLVVDTLHATADRVFRSVVEDSRSSFDAQQNLARSSTEKVQSAGEDLLGLPAWFGIDAGIERLEGLLKTLKAFVCTATQFQVAVPVSIIINVTNRFLSLLIPINVHQDSARINPEFGRDEREALLLALPHIHRLTIEILSCMTERLAVGSVSVYTSTLQQCLWVLNVDGENASLRTAVYRYVKLILELFGLSVPRRLKEAMSECINACCEDLLPSPRINKGDLNANSNPSHDISRNIERTDPRLFAGERRLNLREAQTAAEELLTLTHTHLTEDYLGQSARSIIDRTAILAQREGILLTSLLYPPTQAAETNGARSVLPFVVRAFPESKSVEAVIRPRMPIIQTTLTLMESQLNGGTDTDMQEASYAQLYSGTLNMDKSHTIERRSFVEDSMQSERQPPPSSVGSNSVEPVMPPENNTQRTETSMIEVPETQPMTVATSNKRVREAEAAEIAPSQYSDAGPSVLSIRSDENPSPKRPRIDEMEVNAAEGFRTSENSEQSKAAENANASSVELTLPLQALKPVQPSEKDSDSDDSSVHIDPTLDTEDEEEEDEDAGV